MFNQLKENTQKINIGLQKLDKDIGFLLHNYVPNSEKRTETIITEKKQFASQIEEECRQFLLEHKAFENHLNSCANDLAEMTGKITIIMDEHGISRRMDDDDEGSPPHAVKNTRDESGINLLDDNDSSIPSPPVLVCKSDKKMVLMETPGMGSRSNSRIKTRLF